MHIFIPRLVAYFIFTLFLIALGGCQPLKLVRLYFQEKQYVEDQTLIAKVRGVLQAEPVLRDSDIRVSAYLKDVTIEGVVENPEQASRAGRIARQVDGVESLTNNIVTGKSTTERPR